MARYDVRVLNNGTRFEHVQDEPLAVDDMISLPGVSYQVVSLTQDESGYFDAIVEAKRVAGPAHAE